MKIGPDKKTPSLLSASSSSLRNVHTTTKIPPKSNFDNDNPITNHSVQWKIPVDSEKMSPKNMFDEDVPISIVVDERKENKKRKSRRKKRGPRVHIVYQSQGVPPTVYENNNYDDGIVDQARQDSYDESSSDESSSSSVSWSLPGLKGEQHHDIDPKFLNDNYYQDQSRRQRIVSKMKNNNNPRKCKLAADDQSVCSVGSVDTIELLRDHFCCRPGDRVTLDDWVRCY